MSINSVLDGISEASFAVENSRIVYDRHIVEHSNVPCADIQHQGIRLLCDV